MRSQQKLGEDSHRLSPLGQLDQPGVSPPRDARVRLSERKHAHLEPPGIEPADNFPRISHLRVGQARIGKAVHENPNGRHPCNLAPVKPASPNLIRSPANGMRPFYSKLTQLRPYSPVEIP